MEIQYQKLETIEKLFGDFDRLCRIAFCAALSERAINNYTLFDRDSQRDNFPILRHALDEIWLGLANNCFNTDRINDLLKSCENTIPDDDDNNISNWVAEAGEASACICHTLDLCLENDLEFVKRAVACVHNSLDYYLGVIISAIPYDLENRDKHIVDLVNMIPTNQVYKLIFLAGERNALLRIERDFASVNISQEAEMQKQEIKTKIDEIVKSHPLLLAEIKKENDDLNLLRRASITPEILSYLKTSSENNGKSFLNIEL